MSHKLIGRFYFKLTINGNLTGEFSNSYSKVAAHYPPVIQSESADNTANVKNFGGIYNTTWR